MHYIALTFILSFVLSYTLTKLSVILLTKHSIVDIPVKRSNHTKTIPRGGGLGIVLTIILFSIAYYLTASEIRLLYFIAALSIVATISFIDDIKNLSILTRTIGHFIAIALVYQTFDFSMHNTISFKIFIILGTFCFINFYNFMDGIDGSAALETIHICTSLLTINYITGALSSELNFVLIALLGSSLAFLFFNWQPAKIFLGDIGSISIGLVLAWALASLFLYGYKASSVIIPLYYLADSSITMLIRLFKGKKIWHSHSEHFFQKAVRNGATHKEVAKKISVINLALFFLSIASLWYAKISLLIASIIVALFLYHLQLKPKS